MGASKKQRGKQRKAMKSKAAEGGIGVNISDQVSPTKFVTMIQRGTMPQQQCIFLEIIIFHEFKLTK